MANKRTKKRAEKKKGDKKPQPASMVSWLCSEDAYTILAGTGYTRLSDNPEVQMAVNYIADLISSMTIRLMKNTKDGDIRVHNNLARKVDIEPWEFGTRKTWMFNNVRNTLISGNQVVYPHTQRGLLQDLEPWDPSDVSFFRDGRGYYVRYKGNSYAHNEVLHFLVNPNPAKPWVGMGYQVALKEIVGNLKQATKTKKAFMQSEWKPSVIVKVDALVDEFADAEGRKQLLQNYISTSGAGEPWVIPADSIDVTQVKPLSLNDLAINDAVKLDKRTVAGILGVPPYVVGAGEFKESEHRNFVDTRVMPYALIFQQELTRKLLISDEYYWKFSGRSLYGYNIETLANVGSKLAGQGLMIGNEVRDWIDLPPHKELNELRVLENYVPADRLGDQKKLRPKGEESEDAESE